MAIEIKQIGTGNILLTVQLDTLRGANLKGLDLRYADLNGLDMRGADLRGTDLSYASLIGADLSGADLSGANLSHADMRRVNLRYADLIHADLRDADVSYANLRRADLRGANLSGANLSGADLSRATYRYKIWSRDGAHAIVLQSGECGAEEIKEIIRDFSNADDGEASAIFMAAQRYGNSPLVGDYEISIGKNGGEVYQCPGCPRCS